MSKTHYLLVSYKAYCEEQIGLVCEGHSILKFEEPFTYDDLIDRIKDCVNSNACDKSIIWKEPIIISISELSKGLFKQLAKRRKEWL